MNKILKFWFGYNQTKDELKQEDYKHKPELWFNLSNETDELICAEFASTLNEYENKQLNVDTHDPETALALLILLDQMSQNIYRGQPKMFSHKQEAVSLAKTLLSNLESFSSIEKYFIFVCLLNDEDKTTSRTGLDGIRSLHQNETNLKLKQTFLKYSNSAEKIFGILARFNRFPHRNKILNRESTKEEILFLSKSAFSLVKTVKQIEADKPISENPNPTPKPPKEKPKLPVQNLLYLHGFRQSSNKIKKRLLYQVVRPLLNGSNAYITFLNGTHPYTENKSLTDHQQLNMIESQRVWYNLHDEDKTKWNSETEMELNESLAYVLAHARTADGRPVYDGVIGFSQGAVLASILVRKYPNLFRYFISISGYKTTQPKYALLFESDQIDLPSLHIYGLKDTMVKPSASIELGECFKNAVIVSHSAGHFAPDFWPNDKMNKFIIEQSKHIKPKIKFFNNVDSGIEALKFNVYEINYNLLRFDLSELEIESLFLSKAGLELYNFIKNSEELFVSSKIISKTIIDELSTKIKENFSINDKLLLIYYLLLRNKSLNKPKLAKSFQNIDRTLEEDQSIKSILNLWTQLHSDSTNDYLIQSIEIMFFQSQNWHELIYLADLTHELKLTKIYQVIIDKLCYQLIFDLKVMDKKRNTHNYAALVSNQQDELKVISEEVDKKINDLILNDEELIVSSLGFYFPRIKSSLDRRSRIARDSALCLNKYDTQVKDSKEKILSYNHFRKILSVLTYYIKQTAHSFETNPRVYFNLARCDKEAFEKLLESDTISDAILNPVPEPVDIASHDQMQPLYDWLHESSGLNKLTEADLKFLRGTVTTDGRLDLCKQVIGPEGVQPLLNSMQNSKHVDRILLGNNIIGDDGAKLIAEYIKSGKSNINIWYIAGNRLTREGIAKICEALKDDKQVTGLWLKRNPLKSDGMIPISDLFAHNTTIQVLDLLNCGLLDAGARILFEGLKSNKSLKHLYLSANGITPVGLQAMMDYFEHVKESQLETLFLGCNRIGNEGARLVSECLAFAPKLTNLNMTSSRIGALGMKYLCAKLKNNRVLNQLDLGYMRATMDLGELNNFIQDEGVFYLGDLLKSNSTRLISLNITHNHISQAGFETLVDAMKINTHLIYLNYKQLGVHFKPESVDLLKEYLQKNQEEYLKTYTQSDLDAVLMPEHVKEIYSVYRTH